MTTTRGLLTALVLLVSAAACSVGAEQPVASPESSAPTPSSTRASTTSAPTSPTSRADSIRAWEALAGEHFKQSAAALEKISVSSAAEDEVGLRSGCQQLHDTNSIGLQADLPTPDRKLTNELQRMIDDMNVAAHACLRFALARDPADADNYQMYLERAVEHLQRAKVMLNALEK